MQLSRISKALAVISLSTVLGACSLLGVQTVELGYHYAADKPGHRDIVQVYDLNGHTVIQFRDAFSYAKVTDAAGRPIPYKAFGTSYELDRVYSRFSVTTGRTTINIRRQTPQHERLLKPSLIADTDDAVMGHTQAMGRREVLSGAASADDIHNIPYLSQNQDPSGDVSALKGEVKSLTAELNALKTQFEALADAREDATPDTPALEPQYDAAFHTWATEHPQDFTPSQKLTQQIEAAFDTASKIRIITYRSDESDDATDAAGLRGELVKQYFLDLGVPKDIVSTNILMATGKGKAFKRKLKTVEIRFIR